MRIPRVRFTVRRMMAAVAAVAVLIWSAWELIRPRPFAGRRFALIGPMDIDRDGRDDRAVLKRMIRRAGGSVDFDLPASGRAEGEISALTAWYVVDHRTSAARPAGEAGAGARARLEGVRPLLVERLLSGLGKR